MTLRCDPEETEPRYLREAVKLDGKRILEVGCGNGRLTWRYAQRARRVVGIDHRQTDLRDAQDSCPPALRSTVRFAAADALALPFATNQFDVALLAWSL
jgi:ubiquinone/menaquinone biosynthesis C-methylase UbiE